MSAKKPGFQDDFEDDLKNIADLSDDELERLMGGGDAPPAQETSVESLEGGERVEGIVLRTQGDELLVELDGKTLGIVDCEEFEGEELPRPGERIRAEFLRFDSSKDACVLTTRAVRTEVAWEELQLGTRVKGQVTATNKGGLTLDIKGVRAFIPISQIERERVEDLEPYVGLELEGEVIQIDRADRNLVVSRRVLLEREHEAQKQGAIEKLEEGAVVRGRVTRLTEHGAFVDLGGVDGLLHASKIDRPADEPLQVGQQIEVEIVRVDRERGRVALDFRSVEEGSWDSLIEAYRPGDEVTGWVSRREPEGAILALEEGLEALIPDTEADGPVSPGAVVRARVLSIDAAKQRIVVKPLS